MKKKSKSVSRSSRESSAASVAWASAHLSPALRKQFQSALLTWYDKHGRELPWRSSSDPYRVWLSEIMLQQTTVTAVVPYFERFLAVFPTVHDLAVANVDQVLRLWEGLGYYSRARNLHRAANMICDQHGGQFPSHVEQLNALPGVGRYTAGAIVSFAFNRPAPIVEANTERLYARLMGLRDDVKSSSGQKQLWQFAETIVPQKRAGDANQALMDVGSSICTPQDPNCSECPLSPFCKAFLDSTQKEIPVRKPRTTITEVNELAVVLHHNGKVLLRRRTSSERWAGMWDFARFEVLQRDRQIVSDLVLSLPKQSGGQSKARSLFELPRVIVPDEIAAQVDAQLRMRPTQATATMEFKYSVTRYRVTLSCLLCDTNKPRTTKRTASDESPQWFPLHELQDLPLSQTGRRIANWVSKVGSNLR